MYRDLKSTITTELYFAITAVLVLAEYSKLHGLLVLFKPILIPTLLLLYIFTAKSRCNWYIAALFFALLSNILLLYPDPKWLLYGILSFLFYRIATIVTVVKIGDKIIWLPLMLATTPFLFIFSYLIYIMISPSSEAFYPTVINDIIISIFSGIGLSSYVMNDSKQNSWLIISTLLFTFLVILFMIENFYLSNAAFKPISALVFSLAHFAFYLFMRESENNH